MLGLFFFVAFSCPLLAYAVIRSITIDDLYGDAETKAVPVYLPAGAWVDGQGCAECAFHPDTSRTYGSTWHDSTHHTYDPPREVQFNFTGTTITVYCILPNLDNPTITTLYDLLFTIDGISFGSFSHASDNSNNYMYQAQVFGVANLTNTTHAFSMIASSTTVNSTILFDYAVYSFDDGIPGSTSAQSSATSPSGVQLPSGPTDMSGSATPDDSPRHRNLGVILGSVVGGLVFIIVIGIFAVYLHRRHRRRLMYLHPKVQPLSRAPDSTSVEPFLSNPPPRWGPIIATPPVTQLQQERQNGRKRNLSDTTLNTFPRHKRDRSDDTVNTLPRHKRDHSDTSLGRSDVSELRKQVAELRSKHRVLAAEGKLASPLPEYSNTNIS